MSNAPNRHTIIGVWFAILAVVAGAGAFGGVSITMGTRALLLVACLVPPAIMLMVWRGAPVAETAPRRRSARMTLTHRHDT
jgi:multisubunit Na+/H+ antiporter MnhG subunit